MAAPNYALRTEIWVAPWGTDDAGYNGVGSPMAKLTIAAALADLAANYPAASATAPHVIALEPGTYATPAFALPPFTFIVGDPDGPTDPTAAVVVSLTGNVTLAAGWNVNQTAFGGFINVNLRQLTAANIDLTFPVPAAGNPARTIYLYGLRTNSDSWSWEATSTADAVEVKNCVHDGNSGDAIEFSGGSQTIAGLVTKAPVLINATASIATLANISGLYIDAVPSAVAPGVSFVSGAQSVTARMGFCDNRALTLNEAGAGTLTVYADAVSIPLVANITFAGTATDADLIRTTDAGGSSGGTGLFADGSAALPSIAFLAQPSTGIYRPASGQIGFTTVGVKRAIISIGAAASTGRITLGDLNFPTYFESKHTDNNNTGFNLAVSLGGVYINAVSALSAVTNLNVLLTHDGAGGAVQVVSNTPGAFGPMLWFGSSNAYRIEQNSNSLIMFSNSIRALQLTSVGNCLLGGLSTDGTGVLQFPAATTSAGGITFGADVNIFRQAAGTVYFDYPGSNTFSIALANSGTRKMLMAYTGAGGRLQVDSGGLELYSAGSLALTLDSSQNGSAAANFKSASGLSTNGSVTSAGTGANHSVIDNNGTFRALSYGADTSTNGAFSWISLRSNGSSSTTPMTLSSAGALVIASFFEAGGEIKVPAGSNYKFNARTNLTSPADGLLRIARDAADRGVTLDITATADELLVNNFANNAVGTVKAKLRASNGTAGANFSGLPTSITVVDGVVTAVS